MVVGESAIHLQLLCFLQENMLGHLLRVRLGKVSGERRRGGSSHLGAAQWN